MNIFWFSDILLLITETERMIFMFKEIQPRELADNPFKLIGDDWTLVTSGSKESFNTMTASWGGVGIMWGDPVAITFIRPQRYTFGFTEQNDYYSLCFFDEKYRSALKLCGTKSGRDVDKVKETGLTPAFTKEGVPYFEEARLVLICKKQYAQLLNEESVVDESIKKWYDNDYHKMYISEIVKVLKAE